MSNELMHYKTESFRHLISVYEAQLPCIDSKYIPSMI